MATSRTATTQKKGAAPKKGAVTPTRKSRVRENVETPKKVVVRRHSTTRAAKKTMQADSVRLDAYIPDPEIAENYVPRMIHGVWDYDLLVNARKHKRNVLLQGDTGSGKTLVGEAFAAKEQVLYYSLPCDVSIDPSALFGKMQPTDVPGKFVWQDGPVTQVVREGGVLNISEVNFMPPKIAASLYPLLDRRRYIPLLGHQGEVVRAHPNLLIIADMNPQYRGTMELNAAFKNRFPIKVRWGYEDAVENRLVHIPTLRDLAKKIRAMVGVEVMTPVSTNMLMEFEEFALDDDLGLDFAIENFLEAFDADERDAVYRVMELAKPDIQKDLAFVSGEANAESDEELEEAEFEIEVDD